MMDYYESKFRGSGDYIRMILYCLIYVLVVILVCSIFYSCKTYKKNVSEQKDTKDSVRIEYMEKIVKVPVTVEVEVPVEVRERFSRDSVSHLETSFAVSDASMIWIDGVAFLRHSLENKTQKIEKTDSVPVIYKECTVWKTRRVNYTKTEIRERQLTWWQNVKVRFADYVISFLVLILVLGVVAWKRSR